MHTPLIFIGLALAIGVVLGTIIQDDEPGPPETPAPTQATKHTDQTPKPEYSGLAQATPEIASLQQLLQGEIAARQALERKLDALQKQVAALEKQPRAVASTAVLGRSNDQGSGPDNPENSESWFNEQALLETGMDDSQASELRSFFEQLEMERLYLRDQARREDWDGQRLREAMQALNTREEDLKTQLGDKAYDAYLYASGQPNRVEITSVLSTSPAGNAGILAGDQLYRYDNQRVYTGFDLRQAISAGNSNETVVVEVMRDGKAMQFYLPRGPLGIRMDSVSVKP